MDIYDLNNLTYQEWLQFTFADARDATTTFRCNSTKLLRFCRELFANGEHIPAEYSDESLLRGFSFMSGGNGYLRFLSDRKVPTVVRRECLLSMEGLFRGMFSAIRLKSIEFMWFELLLMWSGPSGESLVEGDESLLQDLLQLLERILSMPRKGCRMSALHGLSHLHRDAAAEVHQIIDRFLSSAEGLTEEVIKYAMECREGLAQ